jgi:transmembrane sensor
MRANMDSEPLRSDQVEETAARWFARQQSGVWGEADQAQFDAWLEASTANRIQYVRVRTAWEQSARMKALGAGVPPGAIPPRGSWGDARFFSGTLGARHGRHGRDDPETRETYPASPIATGGVNSHGRRFTRPRILVAAAAVLASLAVGMFAIEQDLFAPGTRYSTAIGDVQTVSLDDGSTVMLNTDTSIRVALTEHERRVQLTQGEAFFEVAKDKLRPFIVYAGEKRVMAVGTKFSVRRDRDDIQVVVTEGRVNLAASADQELVSPGTAHAPAAGAGAGPRPRTGPALEPGAGSGLGAMASTPTSTFLDAGAVARTRESEVLVRPGAVSDAEKLLSWRRGYVSFDNVTLADAVAEFNRYNKRKLVIEDPSTAAIRVGGNFRANNIDAFLDLMQTGFPIAVEQDGDRVVLKAR